MPGSCPLVVLPPKEPTPGTAVLQDLVLRPTEKTEPEPGWIIPEVWRATKGDNVGIPTVGRLACAYAPGDRDFEDSIERSNLVEEQRQWFKVSLPRPPADAFSGPRHAADVLFDPSAMDEARERLRRDQGAIRSYRVMIDQLETRVRDGRDGYLWDAQGWYGGDIDKLWVKTEGEGTFGERTEQAEVQALWSRAITPWFDVQAGARYDVRPDPERGYAVFGLQGLVPYMFELDTAAFVSNEGDVSARLEGEYELLITQRLILQPRAEINLAVQEVRELGIGSGVNDVELGLRLRYEFAREFAPYIGVNWERKLGETADFARDDGESVDDLSFVAGVRLWF